WIAPLGCCTSCVCPALGSPGTIVCGGPPLRETTIVPAVGESHDASSVPLCVTRSEGTTCGSTEPPSVVQANAFGTTTSAATRTARRRIARRWYGPRRPTET